MSEHAFGSLITTANEHVWALVCGYAPLRKRRECRLVVLVAHIDDAKDDNAALVMAGYIASAAQWAEFSDQWQRILDMRMPYPIPAYHASKMGVSDEARDRSAFLYRVIEEHVQTGLCVCLPLQPFYKWCENYNIRSLSPYHIVIKGVINLFAQQQHLGGIDEPVNFVFDQRSEAAAVYSAWEYYTATVPEDILRRTGATPVFADDEKVRPLQAGDMLSWHILQQWRAHKTIMDDVWPFPWSGTLGYPMFKFEFTEQAVKGELWRAAKAAADLRYGFL